MQAHPEALDGFPATIGVTMIVPDNEAFEKIADWGTKNDTEIVNILRYHIFPGTVSTATTEEGVPIFARTLLDGARVIIDRQHGEEVVFTSGADRRSMLLEGDIQFSDGLIQIVETVMVPPPSLVQICRDYNPLSAFLGALYQTNLSEQVTTSKNVTIFAPNNAAFQRISGALSTVSQAELLEVMKFHIVPTVLYSKDLVNGTTWPTLGSKDIIITVAGNNRYVTSSQILDPDILIDFGVVHILGDVLNPANPDARPVPTMVAQPPAFKLSGSTSTGNKVPVPFTSALPCTADCTPSAGAVTYPTLRSTPTDNGGAGALAPRCTGLAGAMGVGVLGVGMLEAAGMF